MKKLTLLLFGLVMLFNSAMAIANDESAFQPRTIALQYGWDSSMSGGKRAAADLASLLLEVCTPSTELTVEREIEIYRGLTHLMPLREAVEKLGLTGRPSTRISLSTPGFPRNSMRYHSYDGLYEGGYNKLYLVTDAADQLVCIQLVAENPRAARRGVMGSRANEWSVYNFISHRSKSSKSVEIFHDIREAGSPPGRRSFHDRQDVAKDHHRLFLIESEAWNVRELISYHHGYAYNQTKEQRCIEKSRLYLPEPLARLILAGSER